MVKKTIPRSRNHELGAGYALKANNIYLSEETPNFL